MARAYSSPLWSTLMPGLGFGLLLAVVFAAEAGGQMPAAPEGMPRGPVLQRSWLTPEPRELRWGAPLPVRSLRVMVPGGDAEDSLAARRLERDLTSEGLELAPASGQADMVVTLLRSDATQAKQMLVEEKLGFSTEMQDEGYVLSAQANGGRVTVCIVGATAAGVFYGTQTLRQLLQHGRGMTMLGTGTVRDWPAMRYRGVHDDLSRGPFPMLDFMKHQMDVLAAHKVNVYSPYFEHTLLYSKDPLAAPPGGSLRRAEARELAAYARSLHITVVPEQEAFGHLHHVLTYETYADVAETPHGHVLAPGQAGSQPMIRDWFTQIAEDFPGPFLHIGADETFELGTGRTKPAVEQRGLGQVYADFLTHIHTTLAPLHRRLLFWGDVAGSDPAAISELPNDMIAIPWIYWHKDSYDEDILPFKKAGMETWVAPGDANWKVVYPIGSTALDNIAGFVEAGQRLGSTGELTVVWNDDGEGLFNQDWFGVLFGAAAGWQPGKSDATAYQEAFGRTFYGDDSGALDQAQKEMMLAVNGISPDNEVFWIDPWSPAGLLKGKKLRAGIPEARLHAERAIRLIEMVLAGNPGLREREAAKAMELGARRLDLIGLKFQLSEEMRSAYAKALTMPADDKHENETRELLYSISSMNGRCQDLRDQYSLLKDLYRESWLAENRPYWIDNVLVRYDLRIELWQKRGDAFDTVIHDWQQTQTLAKPEQAGIPKPDAP